MVSTKKSTPAYSFGSSPRDKHLTPASATPDVPFLDASVSTSIGAAPKFSFSKSPRLEDTGRSLAATGGDFYSAEVSLLHCYVIARGCFDLLEAAACVCARKSLQLRQFAFVARSWQRESTERMVTTPTNKSFLGRNLNKLLQHAWFVLVGLASSC